MRVPWASVVCSSVRKSCWCQGVSLKFQRESGLADCFTRPSPAYGRRREWSFADIRLAWTAYYRRK